MDLLTALGGGNDAAPIERYWGEQTERSRLELPTGTAGETMPREIIRAFGILKKAAARVNFDLLPEQMSEEKCAAIFAAVDEVIRGRLADEFPLAVWQTGAGTKTNVNVNEVVARRGSEMADEELLSPDDVNLSQPPSGAFPAVAHIASALALEERLLPAVQTLIDALGADALAEDRRDAIEHDRDALGAALPGLFTLALNDEKAVAPEGFASALALEIARQTGRPFVSTGEARREDTRLGGLLAAHGAMKTLAVDLMALADDLRRPDDAARSEETDPTPCERLEIAAVQVMGNDAALGFAAAQSDLGTDEFMPVCAYNFLQSARLLSESITSFAEDYASGGNKEG